MTEYDREQNHRVWCPCGFDERYASKAVATAQLSDHDELCPNTPEHEVLDT